MPIDAKKNKRVTKPKRLSKQKPIMGSAVEEGLEEDILEDPEMSLSSGAVRIFDKTVLADLTVPPAGYAELMLQMVETGADVPPMLNGLSRGRVSKFLDGIVLKGASLLSKKNSSSAAEERGFEVRTL